MGAWAGKGDGLRYIGSVCTGFQYNDAVQLRGALYKLATKRPAVEYNGCHKDIAWAKPTLITKIEYRAWTDDGKLRHASYKGLRDVQDNASGFTIV